MVTVDGVVAVLGMAVVVVGRGGGVCVVVVLSSGAFVVERCGLTADADTKNCEFKKMNSETNTDIETAHFCSLKNQTMKYSR